MKSVELVIGTTNEAKVKQIRGALLPLGLIVNGVTDRSLLPLVSEDFPTVQENARAKAVAYAKTLERPILSMDNALYFKDLAADKQPGTHVRRINGQTERGTDEEMLVHYLKLVKDLGERVSGWWEFAICIATPSGECYETTLISPRIFASEPTKNRVPGYPLESMQIDPDSGKYLSDMTQEEQDLFWQRAIGEKLCEFVDRSLDLIYKG